MNHNPALLVGRILASAIFIIGGYGKLTAAAATQASFAKLGLPLPAVAYWVAVVIELAGGILLLIGLQTRAVALVLGLWCVATALAAHTDLADRMQQIQFMKNMCMTGGFLAFVAAGAGAYSLDAAMGRRRAIA